MKQTEGEVEVEVEKPELPINTPLVPEPHFETTPKQNRRAGIVILILAILGILAVVYLNIAHWQNWWPWTVWTG